MRYCAHISYDGSKFLGFQRLNNGRGIQNALEVVLSKIEGRSVLVKGAGRTDACVHAIDQCIHFDLDRNISLSKLKYSMNQMLPSSISVNSISSVDLSFHARHCVKSKTYLYKLYIGEKNPFIVSYAFSSTYPIMVNVMKECSRYFIGNHDFHNFVSGYRESYISSIESFKIFQEDDFIYFEVTGKSFYRYMVRSLVGALLEVGWGKKTCDDVLDSLKNPDKAKKFFIAPPQGLYLKKIDY